MRHHLDKLRFLHLILNLLLLLALLLRVTRTLPVHDSLLMVQLLRRSPHIIDDNIITEVRNSRNNTVSRKLSVLRLGVLDKLVLAIVADTARITPVRLLVGMPAFVVISVADCSESLGTVLTLVRLFTSMNSHMNQKIAPFVELFVAVGTLVIRHAMRICWSVQAGFALATSL